MEETSLIKALGRVYWGASPNPRLLTLNFYQVGETVLIKALEESILGIKEGGKRRISVIPERGWRITDKAVSFLI